VAHSYNPCYSGGRDQEDHGLKPAKVNSSQDPISKKIQHKKKAGGVAQGIGPEFKSQYHTHTHTHKNLKVIPAIQKTETGGSHFKSKPGKK
jgi:hypothetical protein